MKSPLTDGPSRATTARDQRPRPIADGWQRFGSGGLLSWQAIVFAIVATSVTLWVRLAIHGSLGEQATLVIFTVPILLSAHFGGLRSGLLATAMSCLYAAYFLLPPLHSFLVESPVERWQLFFLGLAGVVISTSNEALHRARRRAAIATRARQAAEEDRERFFSLSQDVICILGFDGYFKDVNPAWEKTLGHTKAELLATPFIEFVHPEDRAATLAEAAKVAGGKELIAFENRYRCKDGSHRSFQWSLTPVVADRVMYGVARDITERKRVEEARRASEVRYSTLFECAPDGILTADSQGIYLDANGSICRMLGYTRAEMVGLPSSAIVAEAEIPHIGPALHAIATASPYHREWQFRRKDGSSFDAEVIATKMPDGKVLAMIRDVTACKQAEAAVRDNEQKLRNVIDGLGPDMFLGLMTPAGILIEANRPALVTAGLRPEDVLGRPFDQTYWWGHSEPARVQLRAAMARAAAGEPSRYDVQLRVAGDRLVWADFSLNPVRDAGGQVIYIVPSANVIDERVQAETALLKAGPLQSAIFNSANFSSIATDAKGVIQIFNVGAERMLGYTAAEVVNLLTPAQISDPQEVIARASALSVELDTPITPGFEALVFKAARGIEDIYELTYIRKDGSRFPAVVSVTALRDAQDTIIGYLLIGTDNTARKRAEEALLKAGALQSAIFNSANFSSIATDAKGVIQIFNVGAERMLGYTAAEVMNQLTPAEISDPYEVIARAKSLRLEFGTPIEPGFEALVFKASRGIEDIYELTYIRKDGSRFPAVVSVTALRDAQDAIIGYLLIGTDNTARQQVEEERKKLDQRLRDQQFYTRSLLEAHIDALMTTDPLGIITDVNQQMEALTGCTRDELIGAPFKDCFTDPVRAEAGIKRVLSEKKVTNYELTARARDGTETVVSYNATTFYDRGRKLVGVFAAARDVTERKQFVQALQQSNVELAGAKVVAEQANLAKSEFLSSMSHELRSPLNAILGFAQLMESATPPPAPAQAARIAKILQAGWHLLKLIDEILDLAVIESGQVLLSKESVSLAEVLSECRSMMEPAAQKRGIVMTFPRFNNPVFVHADMTRLKQIVINLLSNAIKYNREKGTIIVDCTLSAPERMRISVRDTGAGLSPEKVGQLFQPFNRLGQESCGVAGTGIGLVVTKRLAELMDGCLGAESTPGKGSVFWCELTAVAAPRLEIESDAGETSERPFLSAGAPLRTLLYVEDNPANMELVEQLIARCPDLRMITAMNATLGIDLARMAQPAVILMDINLPGISGLQALKILREDPATVHIPVVALSANAMPGDIAKGIQAGFFRYLTKPIKIRELMDTLNAALKLAERELVAAQDAGTGS